MNVEVIPVRQFLPACPVNCGLQAIEVGLRTSYAVDILASTDLETSTRELDEVT
jgi:hypothetical protein